MRIAIISDTHDNIWKLEAAIPHLNAADVILHCGDLCSPFIVKQLAHGVRDKPVHIIWGNNDGDKLMLSQVAAQSENIHIHGDFADLDFEGFKVALTHYPEIARPLAKSRQYHLVCYGHDHTAHEEQIGDCLLVNPGEIMGLNGRSSLAIYDIPAKKFTWIDLD